MFIMSKKLEQQPENRFLDAFLTIYYIPALVAEWVRARLFDQEVGCLNPGDA
jgi:hypothetical protein